MIPATESWMNMQIPVNYISTESPKACSCPHLSCNKTFPLLKTLLCFGGSTNSTEVATTRNLLRPQSVTIFSSGLDEAFFTAPTTFQPGPVYHAETLCLFISNSTHSIWPSFHFPGEAGVTMDQLKYKSLNLAKFSLRGGVVGYSGPNQTQTPNISDNFHWEGSGRGSTLDTTFLKYLSGDTLGILHQKFLKSILLLHRR